MTVAREIVPFKSARPPKLITEKDAITKAEGRTRRRLLKYLKKMEELVAGVYIAEPAWKGRNQALILRNIETGEERQLGVGLVVYLQPPDLKALQYLVDRGMGKAPQRYEITGQDGDGIKIIPWMPLGESIVTIEGETVDAE